MSTVMIIQQPGSSCKAVFCKVEPRFQGPGGQEIPHSPPLQGLRKHGVVTAGWSAYGQNGKGTGQLESD
jgi:hypothetical protein